MKTPLPPTRSFHRWLAALATPLVLAAVLASPGCATQRQVAEIVTQSNAATLGAQFDLPTAAGKGTAPAWQQEAGRIDAFIAAHPKQPATTAPLRLRQAMLLLSYHQISLAQAAFNQVQIGDLHSERDQSLKRSERTLVWWFGNSTNDTWLKSDLTSGTAALKQLKEEQSLLSASPDIRDYLAEMRAWIGLSAAKQKVTPAGARESLVDTLDVYAGIFTAEDLAILADGKEQLPDPKALGPDIRRRLRAKAVLDEAKSLNGKLKQAGEAPAHPKTTQFDQWINA